MYTELEIVNHLLQVAGEDQTATLNTSHPAVVAARQALTGYNKEFQGAGWWFNKEFGVKLLPNDEGKVAIPSNMLSFQVTRCLLQPSAPACQARFVRRGDWVYDTVKHTNVIGMAVWADLITLVDIADLPANAGTYLKHLAAQRYFVDTDGDLQQARELENRLMRAWAQFRDEQLRVTGANALNGYTGRRMRAGVQNLRW